MLLFTIDRDSDRAIAQHISSKGTPQKCQDARKSLLIYPGTLEFVLSSLWDVSLP